MPGLDHRCECGNLGKKKTPNVRDNYCNTCLENGKSGVRLRPQKLRGDKCRWKKLGWTPVEFAAYNYAQNGKCAICFRSNYEQGKNEVLAADHNHETGMKRGLLCSACNRAIGILGDNYGGVLAALKYLEAYL